MKPGMKQALGVVFSLWSFVAAAAVPTTVQNLRMWRAPDNTRLVFDLGGSVEHQVFVLEGPDRIVVDLSNARFQGILPEVDPANPLLVSIRTGRPDATTQRFVLDLKRAVKPRSFVLKPVGQYGHRLVIDLVDPQAEQIEDARVAQEEVPTPPTVSPPSPVPAVPAPVSPPPAPLLKREWVVAIDAGHGGEDPGAMGRTHRTREKDVTLAVARELARQIKLESGMRPVLIRDGDYFVELRQRRIRAKKHKADVFVSIHADALPGRRVAYGSSVYALSLRGATHTLAQSLADQENYSELVGGVALNDKPDDVRRTLLDLSTEKVIEHSLQLGDDVISELGKIGRVHLSQVAQANFAVLRAPDVPSVLVETAFISTPEEERRLRDPAYQQRLASAILKGVKKFLDRNGHAMPPPTVTSDAPREHVVRSGETLKSIAKQYKVSVDVLRFINELTGDDVPVGLRLRLPTGS
jgi:N-acetylmuramoyl-L-alanine amidase